MLVTITGENAHAATVDVIGEYAAFGTEDETEITFVLTEYRSRDFLREIATRHRVTIAATPSHQGRWEEVQEDDYLPDVDEEAAYEAHLDYLASMDPWNQREDAYERWIANL